MLIKVCKFYCLIFYIVLCYIFYILLCPYCTICHKHAHVDINTYYVFALWPFTLESTSSAHYLLDSVHTIQHALDASAHVPHYTHYVAKLNYRNSYTLHSRSMTSSRMYSIELCKYQFLHCSCTLALVHVHWTYTSSRSSLHLKCLH